MYFIKFFNKITWIRGFTMPIKGDALLNKLILLFVFDKMEVPISESTIFEMCCSANDWISPMDCNPTISQLLETSFICKITDTNNPLYSITADGRVCLADFFVNIPSSTREKISQFVKQNRTRYRKKQEFVADYFMNKDRTYTVLLRILEQTGVQLELKFVVPNKQIANNIYKKWPDKAETAYTTIYETLVD